MVDEMEIDKVADMELDKVVDMEVDMVADMEVNWAQTLSTWRLAHLLSFASLLDEHTWGGLTEALSQIKANALWGR